MSTIAEITIDTAVDHKGEKVIVHSFLGTDKVLICDENKTYFIPVEMKDLKIWVDEKVELTQEEKETMIAQYVTIQSKAASLKNLEMETRIEVIKAIFNNDKTKGTENFKLPNNFKFKCVKKLNMKLENKEMETTNALATLPEDIAKSLVRWTPTLSETAYNALSQEHKDIIDRVLTITPATPTVELVYPKEAKKV